jgi:MFS family permease
MFEPKPPEHAADTIATNASPTKAPFPVVSMAGVAALTLFTSVLYYVFIVNGSLAWQEIGVKDASEVGRLTFIPSLFILVGAALFRLIAFRPNALQIGSFLAFLGAGLAVIGVAKSIPVMTLGVIFQQTGAGMTVVTLIAWAQTKFPFAHRGRGMGIWTAAFFLGQFVSPWIVHQLDVTTGSIQGAFLATGLAGLVGAGVAFALLIARPADAKRPHAA